MKHRAQGATGIFLLVLILTQCQNAIQSETGQGNSAGASTNNKANNTGKDPLDAAADHSVGGEYMKAFLVAYETFRKEPDIPAPKRLIENYDIELRQDKESYFVHLIPRRQADEGDLVGGETKLGKEVSYTIAKKDYRITARYFYR